MNPSLILSAALLITGARPDLPPEQVQARFESLCADGRWNDAACPALRAELELQLFNDLQQLQLRGEIDRPTLHVAARARFPMLAELGLRRLAKIASPADREAVLVAVDHPSPTVRAIAKQMLDVQDDTWRKGAGAWWRAGNRNGFAGLVPDVAPEPAQLGLAGLKGVEALRYRYFASGPGERRAVFTTKLTPDQVMALVAKGGKVFDGTKLAAAPKQQEALGKSMENVQKEIQAAMARGDMKAVAEISQRMSGQLQSLMPAPEAAMLRPVAEFAGPPANARYVQLVGDKNSPPLTAAASREDAFGGETVLVIQY